MYVAALFSQRTCFGIVVLSSIWCMCWHWHLTAAAVKSGKVMLSGFACHKWWIFFHEHGMRCMVHVHVLRSICYTVLEVLAALVGRAMHELTLRELVVV